jgi:hypothetical protein
VSSLPDLEAQIELRADLVYQNPKIAL